jgi:predicted nucleotidyltransferase component of viral defense system
MSVSHERIVALAAETSFRPETLEKVLRLGELLSEIGRHPLLSKALALKGGTALNLFYGVPRRLSVDLDFNYIAHLDRARMLQDRPEIERAIKLIAEARKYRIQISSDQHAGRKLFLSYASVGGTQDRIEVDLNFLYRLPIVPTRMLTMWQPRGFERPRATVVGFEELAAGKLCALLNRAMPRDLFDTGRLPEVDSESWQRARFRKLFIALAGSLDHPLHSYRREHINRVSNLTIERELWPTLSERERPSADELKQRAWKVVSPLLTLEDPEREYSERIQFGELRPELMFPDDEGLCERLRQHPVLIWKTENARKHSRRNV